MYFLSLYFPTKTKTLSLYLSASITLGTIDLRFSPNLLEYDHGDSFPFDFEPNIIFESKRNSILLSECI